MSQQPKVAVLGAAGGIGQPLALLLKASPLVGELSLYDVANTAGVAADLSHISTAVRVRGFTGPAQLGDALTGCDLVVIPAGALVSRVAVLLPLRCPAAGSCARACISLPPIYLLRATTTPAATAAPALENQKRRPAN